MWGRNRESNDYIKWMYKKNVGGSGWTVHAIDEMVHHFALLINKLFCLKD